jgi:hypothetical protein
VVNYNILLDLRVRNKKKFVFGSKNYIPKKIRDKDGKDIKKDKI